MRVILDAIFKYLAWALFLIIIVMFEIVGSDNDPKEVIRLAVILLCGIIIIDIIFALIGVYRRGSKAYIIHKTERKTEKRIRKEQREQAIKDGALFGKRKQRIEQISDSEYDAPMIVFPPDGEKPKEIEAAEDMGVRARLRAMISNLLPDDKNEN